MTNLDLRLGGMVSAARTVMFVFLALATTRPSLGAVLAPEPLADAKPFLAGRSVSVPLAEPQTRIVFQSKRDGDAEIYSINADGSDLTRLTQNPADDSLPRFSRGATRITFVSDRFGNPEIFVMGYDGGNVARLTENAASDSEPTWSPDGSRIAFSSNRDGQFEIYVMTADGSGVTRLTTTPANDRRPAWSPDGTRIAFISDDSTAPGTGGRLWVMNADGNNPHRLAGMPLSDDPAWSPDGLRIGITADGTGDSWTDVVFVAVDSGDTYVAMASTFPTSNRNMHFGSWSPDGASYVFVDEWQPLGGGRSIFNLSLCRPTACAIRILPWPDITETHADWSRDMTPPATSLGALPAVSPASIAVLWSGSRPDGPADSYSVLIQESESASGAWQPISTRSHTATAPVIFQGLGGHTYYFRTQAIDEAGNIEPWPATPDAWTTVEHLPPSSGLTAMNATRNATHLTLQWSAIDAGGSGIAGFDIEYRIGLTVAWTRLVTRTSLTSIGFPVDPSKTTHFRIRAIDGAENVEPWPTDNGDSYVFPEIWRLAGILHDNAGSSVSGGLVELRSGDSVTSSLSDAHGGFVVGLSPLGPMLSVTVAKSGYAPLPETLYPAGELSQEDFYLAPPDNVIANWSFEEPLAGSDWFTRAVAGFDAETASRHTGLRGLALGGLTFDPPSNVSRSPAESSGPALAHGADGQPHVAWIERSGDVAELLYASQSVGGAWSSPLVLFGGPMPAGLALPPAYRPELATDGAGRVHILWRSWPQGNAYYGVRSAGGAWSLYLIAMGLDNDSLPRLAVDRTGNAHMAWQGGNGPRRDIFSLSRGEDGQWAALENLTGGDLYLIDARNPAIGVDITGTAYLAWENGTGFFATRPIMGGWSTPTPMFLWPFTLSRPRLDVDPEGVAHVAMLATKIGNPNAIAYASFGSALVSHPVVVYTDTGPMDLKQLLVDKEGRPHLAWTTNSGNVFHSARGAESDWTATRLSALSSWLTSTVDLAATATGVWAAWSAEGAAGNIAGGCGKWTAGGGWKGFETCALPWRDTPMLAASGAGDRLDLVFLPWADASRDVWRLAWADAPVGASRVSQRLTIPMTMATPGLSFLYRIDGAITDAQAAFTLTVETELGVTEVFSSLETPGTSWRHVWRDMSAFAGQSITITFAIDPLDGSGGARLALDEVSLGSTASDLEVAGELPDIAGPLATYAAQIRYGNDGGGQAAASMITLTLPAGLSLVSAEPPPDVSGTSLIWQVPALPAKTTMPGIALTLTVDPGVAGVTLTPALVITGVSPELELANNVWQAAIFIGYRAYLPDVEKP